MTTDIEQLPLPEPDNLMPQGQGWPDIPAWSENTVRQLVAHATAAKDAEIEALKSDLKDYMGAANYQASRADRLEEQLEEASEAANALQADLDLANLRVSNMVEIVKPLARLDLRPDRLDKRPHDTIIYARDRTVITVGDVQMARETLTDLGVEFEYEEEDDD